MFGTKDIIKLNSGVIKATGMEKFYIDSAKEVDEQMCILDEVKANGLPALQDYHHWMREYGFDEVTCEIPIKFFNKRWGKGFLWSTPMSECFIVKTLKGNCVPVMHVFGVDKDIEEGYIGSNVPFKDRYIVLTIDGLLDGVSLRK